MSHRPFLRIVSIVLALAVPLAAIIVVGEVVMRSDARDRKPGTFTGHGGAERGGH